MIITETKKKILAVDDAQSNIQTLIGLLKEEYAITVALNGEDALKSAFSDNPPDLILLDVVMPGIDGYEVCQQLKEDNRTKDIPIIFVTAANEVSEEAKGLELGAVDYVTKPYNPNLLKSRIKNHLRLRTAMLEIELQAQKLKVNNNELKKLSQLKNQFLGMASHDLRNPIAFIQMTADLIIDGETELAEEEKLQLLTSIRNKSVFMLSLLNDLLDVSIIESGNLVLNFEGININSYLKEMIEQQQIIAARKKIRVILKGTETPIKVKADPLRLHQVIDNLVSNAVKFSPPNSKIIITVTSNEDRCRIEIKDEGPGIIENDRKRLFQDFARLSAQPTGGEKSTGLGLAISRRVIKAHGGEIGVESDGISHYLNEL